MTAERGGQGLDRGVQTCKCRLSDALVFAAPPLNVFMSLALRRAARRQPDAFERLGAFQSAVFLIIPDSSPVAFELRPQARGGRVRIVRADAGRATARIRGPIEALLGLFAGSLDADAVFFSRTLEVDGDTSAVMALHNAIEAADLSLADIVGAPTFAAGAVNRGLELLMRTRWITQGAS